MTVVESQEELRASAQGAETTAAPRLSRVLTRGLSGKCPACGEGSLFRAYLKRRDACPCCGESFQGLDADDGPAWLTITIVGHVVIPLLYLLETRAALSYPLEAAMLVLVTIALVLFVLPFAKGLFIANLWWNERKSA
ncbi:MAG TPA: DUF983 domain-containing protein [Methylocystis sp.]|nr:DUF983 domain-containing protein [Methylocystis sp.]